MVIPNELFIKIFCRSTIKRLLLYRTVCKRWHYLIANLKLKELILYFQSFPFCKRYPTHERRIKYRNSLELSTDFKFIRSAFIQNLFERLETLFLYDFSNSDETNPKMIPVGLLECFKKLKYLTFIDITIQMRKESNSLNLTNLQSLVVLVSANLSNIILDSPKLTHIKTNSYTNFFRLKNKNSIKFLYCDYYESSIIELNNLEYLFIELIDNLDSDFLNANRLKMLKELHLFKNLESLESLISQKHINKRSNLRIFYFGIEYTAQTESSFLNLRSKYALDKDNVLIYYHNYFHLANQNYFINVIDYNEIYDCFGKIPSDFLDKFKLIYIVEVKNQIKNQFEFVNFLKNCETLTTIKLFHSSLEQKYYDILPEISAFLIQLYIRESIQKIDYHFILRLKNLLQFTTDQNIDLALADEILNTCEHLDCFGFSCKRNEVLIEKNCLKFNTTIVFRTGRRKMKTINRKGEIIKYLNKTF